LYPRVQWERTISASVDISGAPAVAVAENNWVYFAASAKGAVTGTDGKTLSGANSYRILLGAYDPAGVLQWLFQDPKLMSAAADYEPSLSLGSSGELYIAYVTTGATLGNKNGLNIFSPCGTCGALRGPEDIVVARIDGVLAGTPSVAWVVQDYSLNSCARELGPRILYDAVGQRLLLTYQTSGATVCQARVGSPNAVVVALSTNGALGWVYQGNNMNSVGQNEHPSVAVDASGNVYLAYSTTAPVAGGGAFQGVRDIQVIQLSMNQGGCNTGISRGWILSTSANINTPNSEQQPDIIYDSQSNQLLLVYTTNGIVQGGSFTGATTSLVVAAINMNGTLKWIIQSRVFNEDFYKYTIALEPRITSDNVGNIYVVIRAKNTTGNDRIVMFSVNPNTGDSRWPSRWTLICNNDYFRGFRFEMDTKSSGAIGICNGYIYVSYVAVDGSLKVYALEQKFQFSGISAFDYMNMSICDSGCL
jgi:hypothetical protein